MNSKKHAISNQIFIECPDVVILSHPRSGTHFLEASLANHPKIHKRGECFLRYERLIAKERSEQVREMQKFPRRFLRVLTNRPNRLNIAILMYRKMSFFTDILQFSLADLKLIHLLRNPRHVAISCAQMETDRLHLGDKFAAHYKRNQEAHVHFPISTARVDEIEAEVIRQQFEVSEQLKVHSNVLTINYDDITGNKQLNVIPENHASAWLGFLGLDSFPLKNDLKKTGLKS